MLTELGLRRSATEPAVFYLLGHEQNLRGILITLVDDFFFAGDNGFLRIMEQIKSRIKIGSENTGNIKFCGKELTSREDGALEIKLDNTKAGKLEFMQTMEKGATRRLTADEETQIRGKIGQLQWFSSVCRPDLTFSLCNLLSEVNKEKHFHSIAKLNQIIRKFHKRDENKVVLQPMTGTLNL